MRSLPWIGGRPVKMQPVVPAFRRPRASSMIPVVYHPRYNVKAFGLDRLHPFDGRE